MPQAFTETLLAPPLGLRLHWQGGKITRIDLAWSKNMGAADVRTPQGRELADALARYVSGQAVTWPELPFDFSAVPPFHDRALNELARLGHGQSATYGQLAARLNSPNAARAVGQAMAKNPFPLIYPCHRVLAAGGGLGGYGPGLEMKKWLLELENIENS